MSDKESFYETLLQQPMFQGLGYDDLTHILEKVKMDFRNYSDKAVVRKENDPCRDLLFLLKGTLKVSHTTNNNKLLFTEYWKSPNVVGIANLFGMAQYYNRTYVAYGELQTLTIDKVFITHELLSYEVFRYNFLGTLSLRIQRTNRMLWETPATTILKRFVQAGMQNFLYPFGQKEIRGKMVDLAVYVGTTRLNLSKMLNELQEKGLVKMERQMITILDFKKLIEFAQEEK